MKPLMPQIFADDNKKAEAKELKRKRIGSLSHVFGRALSVLTGRKINVNVVDDESTRTPAWSSTAEVWLNLSQIKDDFTPRSITSLNGLSFHELAHLKFTPRNGSDLVQLIKADENPRKLWEAFNCLEDSRIENMIIALLPSVKNWLTATIGDYLLNDVSLIDRAFPLVYGRYYLPKDVRQLASDKYVNQNDLPELKDIIDEYTTLTITSQNASHVFDLIKRFSELLDNLPPHGGNGGEEGEGGCGHVIIRIPDTNGHSQRPTEGYESGANRPASKAEQERILEKIKEGRDVVIDITPKESQSESESDSGGSGGSDKSDDFGGMPFDSQGGMPFDSQGNADDDSDFDSDDYSDDVDDKPETKSGGKGIGSGVDATEQNTQVTDTIEEMLNDVLNDLSKEINQIAKQMGLSDFDFDGGNAKEPKPASYQNVTAPIGLVDVSRAFSRELERLRADYDPSWVKHRDNGKVNALRYFKGDDFDTIFDEWAEGRDDVTEIEAVILLDKSGSMEGANANNAYQAMWAIKKSLERVDARTTVCVFDYETNLLYRADEKADTTIKDCGAGGGTNPEHALLYAKKILADTEKPIRILFMITDGMWNTVEGERAVSEMRAGGVLTCQALISEGRIDKDELERNRHGFELMSPITSAKDILKLGRELVRLAIRRNLSNA